MIKNIMGAAIAVALAVGIGTTGVISNTTYKKPTQIIIYPVEYKKGKPIKHNL